MCVCMCVLERPPDSPTTPNPTLASSPCAPTTLCATDADAADFACPHCPRTFTSRIGLVGHLRIHRTETGEPVSEAPTYTNHTRLNCPHCPRTFTHRMGLFGHMRIHESGIDRSPDTPTTSNTPDMPSPILASSPCALITTTASSVADTDTADYSCSHCPRTFSSRIGLVGHLRIHRTETGEPVPGAPTALASTAHIALAPSDIAWTYSATCASTNTCGRQPPVAPHNHTLRDSPPPHHTSNPTHRKHPTATSHVSGKCASRLGPHAASAARAT
ncbi:hypothetical protein SprV_0301309800 [Sparganum proliferum]